MSMNAVFIQVDPDEFARIESNPALAEALFQPEVSLPLPRFGEMNQEMEERVRTAGPQLLGQALANFDPRLREQLQQRLGLTQEQLASGQGGDTLLKWLQQRSERAKEMIQTAKRKRPQLSPDKEWHGVHYLLCDESEPGNSLLSKAVLGGKPLGDDDEGFSGYGPARCFTADEVTRISRALSQPEVESDAAVRFDAAKMNKLKIYSGFRQQDAEPLIGSFRRLRDFYVESAENGNAMVTCLV